MGPRRHKHRLYRKPQYEAFSQDAVAFSTAKKNTNDHISGRLQDAGVDLSSRAVSRQVLSTRMSLTSVFGMGTGGTSSS